MSTEGSDESQIVDFGLYTTIDPRTEEFVRLSRKRQMRQGCVCAAISAGITVSIVISIILIYKYTIVNESATITTVNPNWLKVMNSSFNELPFKMKIDKTKLGFDPATIKFLPLILKTLKKNKYFDTIIEDSTVPILKQDTLDVSEDSYNKNIFSHRNDWMRMPTSRLYTIEYKTSPIIYLKTPTRSLDHFRKVRKIRDYQRIMNYFDKMVNERVTFGSTVPLAKHFYNIKSNSDISENTTPIVNIKAVKITQNTKSSAKNKSPDLKPVCYCQKRMSHVLSKLISSLQNLLPNSYTNNILCEEKYKTTNKYFETATTIKPNIPKINAVKMPKVASNKQHRKTKIKKIPNLDYTLNNIIELLKPSIISRKINTNHNLKLHKTTKSKEYMNIKMPLNKITEAHNSYEPAITINDYILDKNNKTKDKYSTMPIYTEKNNENIILSDTTFNFANSKEKVDNDEMINNNTKNNLNTYDMYSGETINSNNNQTNNLFSDCTELNTTSTFTTGENNYLISDEVNKTTIAWNTEVNKMNNIDLIITSTIPVIESRNEQTQKPQDVTLEEDLNKKTNDDVTPEESIKHLEDIIKTLNNSVTQNISTNSSSYKWELVNIEDFNTNYDISKSMIPQNRASYLEIQRNNWKPEEHADYENYFLD